MATSKHVYAFNLSCQFWPRCKNIFTPWFWLWFA